ncbi:MAG: HAD family phosphatase [Schleiferiaceae bacterium]|nr:HAD family phosphatase [Schleiferiaceae bacterium]
MKKLAPPEYVIFDMDGTLVDNYHVHIDAWLAISTKYGGPTSREAIIADLQGTNFEICQKYFGPTSEEDAERIAEEKEAKYRELYAPRIEPVKGLMAFLDHLKYLHIPMAVGTMGTKKNACFVIDALGLHPYLSHWRSAECVERGKPHPDIFLECLQPWEPLHLERYQLWVIEDTSSGVAAGKACGATVIGVRTSKTDEELRSAGADYTVGDYYELLKMMG